AVWRRVKLSSLNLRERIPRLLRPTKRFRTARVRIGPHPIFATRPLHLRKPTCRAGLVMSQMCHKRTRMIEPLSRLPCRNLGRLTIKRAAYFRRCSAVAPLERAVEVGQVAKPCIESNRRDVAARQSGVRHHATCALKPTVKDELRE